MHSPATRYHTDPDFRQLVDLLEAALSEAVFYGVRFGSADAREAAELACARFEARQQVEIVVDASLPPGVVEIRSAGLRYWMDVSSGGGA